MGYLMDVVSRYWTDLKNSLNAYDDLKAAIDAKDLDAAELAISHAMPCEDAYGDHLVKAVREYGQLEDHDPAFLQGLRDALYSEYDEKTHVTRFFPEDTADDNELAGYKHPLHVYAWAAFTGDIDKMKELNELGVKPDDVSNYGGIMQNIIGATISLGMFEAMKEVIGQGASTHLNLGLDDFSPDHYFDKPLYHIMNPGLTEALLETGDEKLIQAAKRAQSEIDYKPTSAADAPTIRH